MRNDIRTPHIIEALQAIGLTKAKAQEALATVVAQVHRVDENTKVNIHGLGTWEGVRRPAREGRDPRTGAPMQITERVAVKFTPAAKFKENVNG